MKDRFILHMSDFHINGDNDQIEFIKRAFDKLSRTLEKNQLKVDYLFITGDIIDSKDLYLKVASIKPDDYEDYIKVDDNNVRFFDKGRFKENAPEEKKKDFDDLLIDELNKRFCVARDIISYLIIKLIIPNKKVVICCGNHDTFYPLSVNSRVICECDSNGKNIYNGNIIEEKYFLCFDEFLKSINVANSNHSPDRIINIDDLNILVLDTNWPNPISDNNKYCCVNCEMINDTNLENLKNGFNVILAHKPFYEVCEKARLPYKKYSRTNFMKKIKKFLGANGIYFCGDKHTCSILGENFHDIPHYMCGEPYYIKNNIKQFEVEYNLVQITDKRVGAEKKIHLCFNEKENWKCYIRPQEKVFASLFELSKPYIQNNYANIIGKLSIFESCETLFSEMNDWLDPKANTLKSKLIYDQLVIAFRKICKYRKNGKKEIMLSNKDIFYETYKMVRRFIFVNKIPKGNILNIKGEHGSGKSIFLAYFFGYLLSCYSNGELDVLPCYYNLSNQETLKKMKKGESYYSASKEVFENYFEKVLDITKKEQQGVCLIIDGLEEQDCWSLSTESSVGRAILDVIRNRNNIYYIMSFSQSNLPYLKNTMPEIEYGNASDILYFNPMIIQNTHKNDELKEYLDSCRLIGSIIDATDMDKVTCINDYTYDMCKQINNLKRLSVNFKFLHENNEFVKKALLSQDFSNNEAYKYYISHGNQLCRKKIGYDFIDYAPDVAFLFSYKGYTYERLIKIADDKSIAPHISKRIDEHFDELYKAFVFITKNKDIRDYLVALHYNREIRYYVENPSIKIHEQSILNEFMTRDVTEYIKEMWADSNKYFIACNHLLIRDNLNYCLLSMLFYCSFCSGLSPFDRSAVFNSIIAYYRSLPGNLDSIESALLFSDNVWTINTAENCADAMNQFYKLICLKTIIMYSSVSTKKMEQIYELFCHCECFRLFNRQFQMLYYEDVSIKGGQSKEVLIPGKDIVYNGFDFHNTFYTLYSNLLTNNRDLCIYSTLTLVDLIVSRLEDKSNENNFFINNRSKASNILKNVVDAVDRLLETELLDKNDTGFYKYLKENNYVIKNYIT